MGLIPPETVTVLRRRRIGTDKGVVVWALQRALNDIEYGPLAEDGVFGRKTGAAVRAFQRDRDLKPDGIFGPISSATLARTVEALVESEGYGLPKGLLEGFTVGESASTLGAVNWSVPGGVDCGYVQRRVYDADNHDYHVVRDAFNPLWQFELLASNLRSRFNAFHGKPGATSREAAWRLAALNHNYPAAAQAIASLGVEKLTPYYTTPQRWVQNIGARWPDGSLIETPLDWCRFYSLGYPAQSWPGSVTRFVVNWNT